MLRFLTAGESHGKGLVAILEGMPAGLHLDFDAITEQLTRRQGGYGRGRRMAIESDKAEVLSGVRAGDVQARERTELLERDFVFEGSLDAQRADEDMSEHRAVGERFDGVLVGSERASEVGTLLDLAEQRDRSATPGCERPGVVRGSRRQPSDFLKAAGVMASSGNAKTSR